MTTASADTTRPAGAASIEARDGAAVAAGPPPIETHGLTRTFGPLRAVDALDLTVAPSEIFGLLGPNGAGKTTTIKMLITLLAPTSGSAIVAGADITRDSAEVRRRIGYVPQLVSADGSLTARENLRLSAKLYHLPSGGREAAIDGSLRFMGLADVGDRLVRTYSGGMVRRLELAQAMLHRPAVLFLDEPTVGLDPTARGNVWERVRRLRDESGTTILLTTHYMEEADELCDRIGVMDHGRLARVGTPQELKDEVGPGATLDDVFTALTGTDLEIEGGFRDIGRTRRTAKRLG
ncbi:MAG TPA: ATP-binding cassette domain-containing protein [Candidatus Limnocylindrales bacterium]|nr:ATP-binding cassette domain-containing protein [Candidatus Limnocylindrales bacterium]